MTCGVGGGIEEALENEEAPAAIQDAGMEEPQEEEYIGAEESEEKTRGDEQPQEDGGCEDQPQEDGGCEEQPKEDGGGENTDRMSLLAVAHRLGMVPNTTRRTGDGALDGRWWESPDKNQFRFKQKVSQTDKVSWQCTCYHHEPVKSACGGLTRCTWTLHATTSVIEDQVLIDLKAWASYWKDACAKDEHQGKAKQE